MARASSKRMAELVSTLDREAVVRALEAGDISERQAKNAIKSIDAVRAIREDPIQTVLIQDSAGRFIGEADPLPNSTWRARSYGPSFREVGVNLPTLDEAVRLIRSTVSNQSVQVADGRMACAAPCLTGSSSRTNKPL